MVSGSIWGRLGTSEGVWGCLRCSDFQESVPCQDFPLSDKEKRKCVTQAEISWPSGKKKPTQLFKAAFLGFTFTFFCLLLCFLFLSEPKLLKWLLNSVFLTATRLRLFVSAPVCNHIQAETGRESGRI